MISFTKNHKMWYDNGELKSDYTCNEKLDSILKTYYNNKKLKSIEICTKGILESRVVYNKDGELKKNKFDEIENFNSCVIC